jgi:hypothetical protein
MQLKGNEGAPSKNSLEGSERVHQRKPTERFSAVS